MGALQVTSFLAATAALAAPAAPRAQDGGLAGWRQVEQGVADTSPLSADLRVQPLELRYPFGFDTVYQGRLTDQYGASRDYFARRDGALTAVFPRSIYTEMGNGVRSVDVPPGTVYYIGDLPPELADQAGGPAPLLVPPTMQRPPTALAIGPDISREVPFTLEVERLAAGRRAQLADELLHAAAAAEKTRRAERSDGQAVR
jgi:hypothetical protein